MKPSRAQQDILDEPSRCAPACIDDVALTILERNEHFCVIDKPADVRMDGDFDVTVEKLMLLHIKKDDGSSSSPKDFKWVHQLDFATSGALCVALSRDGAAAASSCFEHREVEKHYLSILSGKLDLDKYAYCEYEPDEEILCPFKKPRTSYHPQSSSAATHETWQAQVRKQNLDSLWNELHSFDTSKVSSECQTEFELLKQFSYDEFMKGPKRRKRLRKLMKQLGVDVDLAESSHTVLPMAEASEPNVVECKVALEGEKLLDVIKAYYYKSPPAIFRPANSSNKLVIRVPVAELDGDFRMEPGHDDNPGKPCETELTVLEYATYQGEDVTKVLMRPRTGRRHQLRIHSLVLGHPIVGDVTYQQQHQRAIRSQATSADQSSDDDNAWTYTRAERMMLHAHSLKIPFPTAGKCSRDFQAFLDQLEAANLQKKGSSGSARSLVDCTAPDPFPILSGVVVPILPGNK
eukprot:gene26730-32299_t